MSRNSRAAALTDSALRELGDALTNAATPEDFLVQADAIIGNPANVLALPTDLGLPDEIHPSNGIAGIDSENGPLVFEFVGVLDPSNAADPRLWTYLAFATYRAYMEQRWPLVGGSIGNNGEPTWKNRVRDRWLLRGTTRGRLVRHGIARLWWVTNLTYDARCEYPLSKAAHDRYAYTRAVFRNEDRINALFDREAGAMHTVVRAVLEHVGKNRAYERDNHVRAVMKELTLALGYRDLGVLDSAALDELIEDIRPRYGIENDEPHDLVGGAA